MPGVNFNPAKSANSRVFIIDGRANGVHQPSYESFIRMTALAQGFGDVTKIEVPDPRKYGSFVEVGNIRGAAARPTASLEGRYAQELKSDLLEMANKGCAVDVQVHFGACTDPSAFNTFDKAVVIENAIITNFSTDNLGALSSADNAAINEKVDLSGTSIYEILPLGYSTPGGNVITNEIVDVIISDTISCGDCETVSDGSSRIYAISKKAGGSAGTPPDIVFTLDKGVTVYAYDIDTLTTAQDPTGLAVVGTLMVVISNDANSLSYCYVSELNGVMPPTWTEVTTGFQAGYEPNAISAYGGKAYIVGDGGGIYSTTEPSVGVDQISLGGVTTEDLFAVYAINEDIAFACGANGTVVFTLNGSTWAQVTTIPVVAKLNCILAKSTMEIWVGTDTGLLYHTTDSGVTWALKAFPGSGSGSVKDITMSKDGVMFLAHKTAATKGRILRSYDGGYSWITTPEATGVFPACDSINAIAATPDAPNMVVGVGLADNAADGIMVIGLG